MIKTQCKNFSWLKNNIEKSIDILKYNISTQNKINNKNKRYIRNEWALKVYGWLKLFLRKLYKEE